MNDKTHQKIWLAATVPILLILVSSACVRPSELEQTRIPNSAMTIAYRDATGNLALIDSDGKNPRQLTTDLTAPDLTLPIWHPYWSPDGNKIAFLGCSNQRWNVYISEVASGQTTNITKDEVDMGEMIPGILLGWSTNSEEIYLVVEDGIYTTSMDKNPELIVSESEILVFNEDRTKVTYRGFVERDFSQLYTSSITELGEVTIERPEDTGPEWYPSFGASSVILRSSSAKMYFHVDDRLYSVNRDGSQQTLVADGLHPRHIFIPSYDGLSVVYLSKIILADGSTNLVTYASRFDGSQRVSLSEIPIDENTIEEMEGIFVSMHRFEWSIDGGFLVFLKLSRFSGTGVDSHISVYDRENARVVPDLNGIYTTLAPAWSANRDTIAFARNSPVSAQSWRCSIILWDVVANEEKSVGELPYLVLPFRFRWSPDDNSIAVTASRANSTEIQPVDLYLVNLTDGEIVKVGAAQDEYSVAWKPSPK